VGWTAESGWADYDFGVGVLMAKDATGRIYAEGLISANLSDKGANTVIANITNAEDRPTRDLSFYMGNSLSDVIRCVLRSNGDVEILEDAGNFATSGWLTFSGSISWNPTYIKL